MIKLNEFKNNYFWFETNKCDKENNYSYYFNNPVDKLSLTHPDQLDTFFKSIEKISKDHYLAGFFSYELGYFFEEKLYNLKKLKFPYALFYVYKDPVIIDHNKHPLKKYSNMQNENYKLKNIKLNITKKRYIKDINKIKKYIYDGDIFQVNHTLKYNFKFSGSVLKFYNDLKQKQKVSYNVFAKIDDFHILSLSPELFFSKNKNNIHVKPMKGTIKRGNTKIEDEKKMNFLINDEKNKSENIMIVDLLRNDLGKISEYGSVKVEKLFECEKYNTLFQMTSTVSSRLKQNISIQTLIKNIFPSGSITGAPKIRSMEIINELEKEERKIYTGAIGFFTPDGITKFNVPIRTIIIDKNRGEMGIGSGIVYDSDPLDEFEECKLKAKFLTDPVEPEFQIIETMFYNKKIRNFNLHIQRLKETAMHFNFNFNKNLIIKKINTVLKKIDTSTYKIRMLLSRTGELEITNEKLNNNPEKYKLTISKHMTNSKNEFLLYKTTKREFYNNELKKAKKEGFFDIIFLNEKNQITEGSITNIYIKKNNTIYTPPVKCGLLNGTMRKYLLKTKNNIKEKIITLNDLQNSDKVYISNAITGFQEAAYIKKI